MEANSAFEMRELAEQRSASYYGTACFLGSAVAQERNRLLLALHLSEREDRSYEPLDALKCRFIFSALYEGGVYVDVDRGSRP